MEETNTQVRTRFRFVKEKDLTTENKHKEIGLFSISEKSLSIGIGGNSYIYLPSIETLNEDFVSKISYTRDMLNKADIEVIYTKDQIDEKIAQAIAGNVVDLSDYYTKSETYSQTEVDDKLLLKADTNLIYTKSEVDDLIDLIPNFDSSLYYNKTEVDDKINLKLDTSVYDSDKLNYVLKTDMVNYYLKKDIDSKLDEKVNVVDYEADKLTFATKDELNLKLDASTYNSDKTTFATKLELSDKADDSKIGDLQNTGLTGTTVTELLTDAKSRIDNINAQGPVDLSNYYTKSETYKKDEIDLKLTDKLNSNALDNYYDKSYIDSDIATKAELADKADDSKVTELSNKLGDLTGTGLTGTTVTELLTDVKSRIDGVQASGGQVDLSNYYDKSQTYSKTEVDNQFLLKADVTTVNGLDTRIGTLEGSIANKVEDSEYQTTKNKALTNESNISDISSKLGNLQNTGLTGSTVTELLTDVKTKIDDIDLSNFYTKNVTYTKSEVDDLIDLIPVFNDSDYYNKTTMDGLLGDKADETSLDDYYNKSFVDTNIATKAELANKANTSDLTNYYTKDEANGLLSNKLDNNALDNYYTKSETYKKDEIDGKVDDKLDASTYNSDKLTYALKTDLSDINIKLEKLNNSIRPVLSLTEDTDAVEGQLDKQTWLTQKLKTEKQLDPENGLVITTSEGDSYFYFDGQWTLKKTYKVSHVTDTVMGIVQSKSDKGYGYIKASPTNDGTMVLTDYQDILDSINLKADDSDLTTLSGKVSTLEGTVSQKADSSSIGNLIISGLSGSNVTELLTSVKGELDLKATKLEVSGIDGRVSTLEGEIANKLNNDALNDYYNKSHIDTTFATKSELAQNYYNSTTIDSKLDAKLDNTALDSYYDSSHIDSNFATKSDLSNKVDNNTLTQDYYNKSDVDQKITQAVTGGKVDLTNYYTKSETYSQLESDGKFALITDLTNKADDSKIGDLQSTGLAGTNVTELLTDAKTKIDDINIGNYYDKSYIDSDIATKAELADKVSNGLFNTLEGKVTTIERTISTKADDSKIGNLLGTGLTGTTVTELLTDANTKITNINISNYYTKREVDDSLNLKLNASEIINYYPKTETYSQTEADSKFALISVVNTKVDQSSIGNLAGTGLSGLTVTELLTDVKTRIDLKASQSDVISLTGRVGTLEGEIINKLNSNALDDYYNKTTIDGLLSNKANQSSIGDLQGTGLTGTTVTELLTDAKAKIDNINIGNYYTKSETYAKGEVDGKLSAKLDSSTASSTYATKSELANKADTSLLDTKLDVSTYNSEKSSFATTRSVEQLNEKLEKFNNSIRPVLMLSEDTSTVEGQSDTQTWLTQKLKTEKQLDPENGLVIITSDGDSYFYFESQWVLRKTYKVGSVTNSTSGIVLGKDEAGHGYIKASDALDGTMVLVDYQDIVDSIRTKAESSAVTTLEGRVVTLEGQLSNKVDNNTLTSYYTSSTVDSLLSTKLDSSAASSTYATKGEVSVKANQSSIGDLTGTGLTGTTVTELLTDANTKINNINIGNYYNKTEVDDKLDLKLDASEISKYYLKTETYSQTEADGKFALITDLTNKADSSIVVDKTSNQDIGGNKNITGTLNISNGDLVLANKVEYNLKTSTSYGIRFQLDGMSGNKDLIRIHKAGSKWNLRYIESGGAFAWCELNGLTWIPNLKSATSDSNATNLGDVKAKINEVLDGTNPFKTRIKAGATGNECRFTPDDRAKILYFSDSQSGDVQWTIDGENKIIFQNMPTPTESHHFATKGYVDNSISTNVGTLTNLTTTAQDNIVNSINEVNDKFNLYKKTVLVPIGDSLPQQTEADTFYFVEV